MSKTRSRGLLVLIFKTIRLGIRSLVTGYAWAQRIMQLETRESLSYWSKLVDNMGCSPTGFYSIVEANIEARRIPGVTVSRITNAEAGFLSPNRKYLRIRFDGLSYDICAGRYGSNGFFITSRLSQIKHFHLISKYLLIAVGVGIMGAALMLMFGRVGTAVAFLLAASAAYSLKRDASGATLRGALDELFSETPVVRSIYGNLLHPDTFYAQDLKAAFQHAVQNAVMRSIDESTTPRSWVTRSTSGPNPGGGTFYGN